ncbi:hypothetical protein JTB14_012544 [Gonioctena quinquepunctata]|nr:hypothetical protein JTB14_012544 [Gonioctena quinquepunctata]
MNERGDTINRRYFIHIEESEWESVLNTASAPGCAFIVYSDPNLQSVDIQNEYFVHVMSKWMEFVPVFEGSIRYEMHSMGCTKLFFVDFIRMTSEEGVGVDVYHSSRGREQVMGYTMHLYKIITQGTCFKRSKLNFFEAFLIWRFLSLTSQGAHTGAANLRVGLKYVAYSFVANSGVGFVKVFLRS